MDIEPPIALTNPTITFTIVSTENVQVQPLTIAPNFILANAAWPAGNDTVANKNQLFVWLNNSSIYVPWGQQPMASAAVTNQSTVINGTFGANQYVVAYSDGPSLNADNVITYPNICATSAIPADWNINNCQPQASSVTPSTVQASVVVVNYSFTTGFNPSIAGSWVGLFDGDVVPYNNPGNLIGFGSITTDTSSGAAVIANLVIAPNQTYTLVLFNTGYSASQPNLTLRAIAAVTVFQTQDAVPTGL